MATIVQPPFYVPSPPEDQPWVAQAYQLSNNLLQELSASALLFQRADQVRKHHAFDDSSAWNASPINANTLQMLAHKPTSPAKTWAQWQHLDDPPVWSGSPLNSGAITATRTQIKIYGQPGQAPTKNWATNQHYDETGAWYAEPISARGLIILVTGSLKFYGAPGQVPTKNWQPQYTQDDPAFWMGQPIQAYALTQVPAPPPKVSRAGAWIQMEVDHSHWNAQPIGSYLTRYPFTKPFVSTPYAQAFTEDVDDAAFWQGTPIAVSRVLPTPLAQPFKTPRWKFDYDETGVWQRTAPINNLIIPQPPFRTPNPWIFNAFYQDDGAFYIAESQQFNADILQVLFLSGQPRTKQWSEWQTIDDPSIWVGTPTSSTLLAPILAAQSPTKRWELSYDYDDPGVWNEFAVPRASPVLRSLLTVGGQPPTKQWSQWLTQDDPSFWVGQSTPLNIILVPPFIPAIPPRWKYDYDETGAWNAEPLFSSIVSQLLNKKPFFYNNWQQHYDEAAPWLAAPTHSAVLAQLATVGGKPPTRRWEAIYDYDDPGSWNEFAAPRSSPLLRPLLTSGIPFAPRFWKQDIDEYSVWLAQSIRSYPLATTIPTGPPVKPVAWRQDYDDGALWLGQPLVSNLRFIAQPGSFIPRFWRQDVDDPGNWPSAPVTSMSHALLNALLTAGNVPFRKQWELHDDDSAPWSIIPRGIPPMVRSLTQGGQPPTKRWESVSDYDDPGPWNEFAAPRASAVLRPLLTAGTPFHKLWTWDFDEGGLWTPKIPTNLQLISPILPIGTPIISKLGQFTQDDGATWLASPLPSRTLDPLLKAGGQPPTTRWEPALRYDVDAAAWEATRRENLLLLTTPIPNPIIPRQWRWDYMIDEPLWQKGPTSAWIDQLISPPPQPVNIDQLRLNSSTRVRSLSILGQRVRLIAGVPNTRQVT